MLPVPRPVNTRGQEHGLDPVGQAVEQLPAGLACRPAEVVALTRSDESSSSPHWLQHRKFFKKNPPIAGEILFSLYDMKIKSKTTERGKHGTAAIASGRSIPTIALPAGHKPDRLLPRSARIKLAPVDYGELANWFTGLRRRTADLLGKLDRHENPFGVKNDSEIGFLVFSTCLTELHPCARNGGQGPRAETPEAIQNAERALAAARAFVRAQIEAEIDNARYLAVEAAKRGRNRH